MLGPLANGKIPSTSKKLYINAWPTGYKNSDAERPPIVEIGAFKCEGKRVVTAKGNAVRGISHKEFLAEFEEIQDDIVTPGICM